MIEIDKSVFEEIEKAIEQIEDLKEVLDNFQELKGSESNE